MDQIKADNASPSDSQMDATSSTTPPKTIGRKRLDRRAIDILEDHFRRVGQNPSLLEKETLLKKIKAIPGCSYDLGRLSGWFASRRQRFKMKERVQRKKEQLESLIDSRFPSLTPAAIQHLTVLATNQLHPSSELLKTWTTLLASSGAIEQDVINWIYHRNQQQLEEQPHTPSPSDASNTTPEPLSAISQSQTQQSTTTTFPYKQETTSSPIMPAALQLPDEHDDDDEAQATPSEPSSSTSNNNNKELNQRIIHGVRDALARPPSQTMPNAAPKTAAEFDALFSPFGQQISLLLHTLEST